MPVAMEELNAGNERSKIDLLDLRHCAARGDTIAEIAAFLLRTEADVREKARELGHVLAAP
jgi:predicted transcriptional regulator